jgi:hypothetical protein
MGGILELIKLIYGSKALSKVLGTRTNVIRLPDNELKQYTKKELNIEAASNKLAQKVKADMYELLAEYPRMNDAERLIFDGNLRRLGNKLEVVQKKQKPAADVLEFETGEKVSPEGIMSLTEKAGQKNPPTTLMGKLESRIKQLEASGEDLSKMKGQTYDEFMNDITQGQRTMIKLEDEGLVRATAREIIDKDIKSKKIKLPKEVEADFKQGGGEPIDVFRQFYGEDALEQLNSMVPDFRQMYSPREAAEAAIKKFKFKFKADRPPGSISIEDAKKAEQEFNIVPADSEEGKVITEKLIGKPKAPVTELVTAEKIILDMKNMDPMDAMKEANKVLKREGKYKNLKEEDVERIMEDTNDFIFGRDIPEDPEGFAGGGRVGMAGGGVSQGLDYLMGIERRGYANGNYIIPIPQSEGRTEETITPIQTSIQQQLTPAGPLDGLINQYLQMPGILSMALNYGKDYIGLTDAQKDLYGNLGFGYSDQSKLMKDKLGFNVMADNFLAPKSTSRSVYKDKLGYTDEELDQIRNNLAGVPTKATMREQQRGYNAAQTQRQQNYFDLANQGIIGIGLNPGAYAAHSLAAMGPAYDDSNQFSNDAGTFGGYGGFDGTEGTFSTDTSDTGASSGGVDSAGDGGDGYATGGRVGYAEGSSNLSREEIINRILQEIKPGFESAREVYPDYYSTGLDVDYLKTLDPDEIKQALDRAYLQGEGFQNADFTSGRIGQGSPFFRYSPEYMKKVNYNNPLQISNSNTAYNLRNQLNELESILGKKNIEAYKTTLDDSLIDYYKNRFTADLDLQKKLFGEQTTPTVEEQMVSPDDAMNQYDIETPETDFFSGPAYDKYSKERTDAYANSPSKFDYDIRANEAAGQFIQDKITDSLGDNKLGRFVGDAAALASVPLAIFGSPFHEAAQVVAENRMEPGSGIKGFAKAFMNEQPISTAINRGAGVLQSTALGKGIYNLGGDLYNLKEKLQQRAPANIVENIDTAVSSLNPYQQQRYVNYAVENPDRAIQAAQRDQDFRTAIERRDQKQKGGLSYLLGM